MTPTEPPADPGGDGIDATSQAPLFGDLLDRFAEIVGGAASEATFHLASVQEGLRIGAGHGPEDLQTPLARIDSIVAQRSQIVPGPPGVVRIAVQGSSLLASGHPARQAVVLGLIEGALRAVHGVGYAGEISAPPGKPGEHLLEFKVVGEGAFAEGQAPERQTVKGVKPGLQQPRSDG